MLSDKIIVRDLSSFGKTGCAAAEAIACKTGISSEHNLRFLDTHSSIAFVVFDLSSSSNCDQSSWPCSNNVRQGLIVLCTFVSPWFVRKMRSPDIPRATAGCLMF